MFGNPARVDGWLEREAGYEALTTPTSTASGVKPHQHQFTHLARQLEKFAKRTDKTVILVGSTSVDQSTHLMAPEHATQAFGFYPFELLNLWAHAERAVIARESAISNRTCGNLVYLDNYRFTKRYAGIRCDGKHLISYVCAANSFSPRCQPKACYGSPAVWDRVLLDSLQQAGIVCRESATDWRVRWTPRRRTSHRDGSSL